MLVAPSVDSVTSRRHSRTVKQSTTGETPPEPREKMRREWKGDSLRARRSAPIRRARRVWHFACDEFGKEVIPMKRGIVTLIVALGFASQAHAAPGDPRLVQGVLEWPAKLTVEPFVVIRADDGRWYYTEIKGAKRLESGPLTAGGRVAVLGTEAARPHEITAIAVGSGDAAALALALMPHVNAPVAGAPAPPLAVEAPTPPKPVVTEPASTPKTVAKPAAPPAITAPPTAPAPAPAPAAASAPATSPKPAAAPAPSAAPAPAVVSAAAPPAKALEPPASDSPPAANPRVTEPPLPGPTVAE